ncbi:hypothetical protein OPIT5_02980 [Opitutaceae bacterium TAV5]|nr:hypothetical protein OPIT5_02980 [Opitutaceae bacterium TAV5]
MKTNLCIRLRPFLAGLSVFACISVAQAVTLLDADFENGTPSGWTSYLATNPATVTVATEQDGGGNTVNSYLHVSSNVAFRGVYHLLSSPVTLPVGETITVSFRLMFTATTSNVRFGLFQYAGGNQDGTSDNGYFSTVAAGGNSLSISRDGDTSNDPGSGSANAITATSSTTAADAFAANVWYDASLTLTLLSTGMEVTATVGDASVTGLRASGNFDTFGMFYIGSGNNNARFAIDDVVVTSTVPEPAAVATLAGIGALGCAALAIRLRRQN